MTLTSPYQQHNYLGEYATDALALVFIQAQKWDSLGNGTGTPIDGMWYYNSTYKYPRNYHNSYWDFMSRGIVEDDRDEPNGFVSRTESTLSWNDGNRTLTITPTGATFTIWSDRIRYELATQTKQIADTEGLHYIYFDSSGVPQETTTWSSDLLIKYCIVSIIYWNAADNAAISVLEERHGIKMSGMTHLYLHLTQGAKWCEGLGFGNFTIGNGSLDSHAQFDCTDGTICDEDLHLEITDGSPQELTPILQAKIRYRSGAAGDWREDAADNFVVKNFIGGDGRLAYNQYTGGAWQQTEVTNLDYVLAHIFASNGTRCPVFAVQGQNKYATLNAARVGAETEITALVLAGFFEPEMVPLGTIIFQTSTGYANTPKARIVLTDTGTNYIDWRTSSASFTSGIITSHSALSNLSFSLSNHSGFQKETYQSASSDPTANNDEVDTAALGVRFRAGDYWLKIDTDALYFCEDATATAASWVIVTTDLTPGGISAGSAIVSVTDGASSTVGPDVSIDVVEGNITHNNLGGLQGGTAGEYYHLTASQESIVDSSIIFAKGQNIVSLKTMMSATDWKALVFFDQFGASTAITDRSGYGHNATLSVNGSTLSPAIIGMSPTLTFPTGAFRSYSFGDHDDFSFPLTPFSIVVCGYPSKLTNINFLSKYDATTGATAREWRLATNASDQIYFQVYDETSVGYLMRSYNVALTDAEFHTYVATYDGGTSVTGLKIYRDGVQIDNASTTSGTFNSMRNTAAVVGNFIVSAGGSRTYYLEGTMSLCGIIAAELTATDAVLIDNLLRAYVGVEY